MYLCHLPCIKKQSATFCQSSSQYKRQRRRVSSFDGDFKGVYISFLTLGITVTLTKYLEKSFSHDLDFSFTVRDHLEITVPVGWALNTNN